MIISKLQGGLGNQMFQYALGRFLSEKNNSELKLDISSFDNNKNGNTPREYSLNIFNISGKIATEDEIMKFKKYERKEGKKNFLRNIIFSNSSIYIKEKKASFEENILSLPNNIYLEGFWQSEKYFKEIETIIRNEFTFKKKIEGKNIKIADEISATNSISVHVRRGDYTALAQHGLHGNDYYKKAEKIINLKIKNPHFFVFSDDIEWAKNNILFTNKTSYVDHNEIDYEDMRLMSLCKNNIIINSSFSWWGAWLNINQNKIVIAPRLWIKKEQGQVNDRHCEGWTII